jgi:hypothetical protein
MIEYIVVYDPHEIGLEGCRFTRAQLTRALGRGDLDAGLVVRHNRRRFVLAADGLYRLAGDRVCERITDQAERTLTARVRCSGCGDSDPRHFRRDPRLKSGHYYRCRACERRGSQAAYLLAHGPTRAARKAMRRQAHAGRSTQ